ncbi:hypothetical protein [Pseudomonas sp. Marseille-QA0332]
MNRLLPGIVLLAGALAVSGQATAHGGGGWRGAGPVIGAAVIGAAVGAAVYGGGDRSVHVERQPAYYPPPPIYVQAPPPPVYYQPYVVERYVPVPPPPRYRHYDGPPRAYYGPPRW